MSLGNLKTAAVGSILHPNASMNVATAATAIEISKFGVSEVHYAMTQPHQLMASVSGIAENFALNGHSPAAFRNSPHKSASPTVDDLGGNVSVLANKPKPGTPYTQSNNQMLELASNRLLGLGKASPSIAESRVFDNDVMQ